MRKQDRTSLTLIVLGTLLLAACSAAGISDGAKTEQPETLEQLIAALQAKGNEVERAETLSQPFFAPEGQVLEMNGERVQVFEFPSEEEAATAAQSISPDGGSISTSMVTWVSPPHFYHSGKLIVLHVGEESSTSAALEELLGPQIAGG